MEVMTITVLNFTFIMESKFPSIHEYIIHSECSLVVQTSHLENTTIFAYQYFQKIVLSKRCNVYIL